MINRRRSSMVLSLMFSFRVTKSESPGGPGFPLSHRYVISALGRCAKRLEAILASALDLGQDLPPNSRVLDSTSLKGIPASESA
jgi:hypothetical protein